MSPSISGISPGLAGLGDALRPTGPRSPDTAASKTDVETRHSEVASPRSAAGPHDIPPGTDPELWAVLTAEERTHFARLRSMGPLTYSTSPSDGSRSASQTRRGVRLDVRV